MFYSASVVYLFPVETTLFNLMRYNLPIYLGKLYHTKHKAAPLQLAHMACIYVGTVCLFNRLSQHEEVLSNVLTNFNII